MRKVIFLVLLLIPIGVSAHSGGTDSNGCHAGSQPYHCHNGKGNDNETDFNWNSFLKFLGITIFIVIIIFIIISIDQTCSKCKKKFRAYQMQRVDYKDYCKECKPKRKESSVVKHLSKYSSAYDITDLKNRMKKPEIGINVFCGACGNTNPLNSNWCTECGVKISKMVNIGNKNFIF